MPRAHQDRPGAHTSPSPAERARNGKRYATNTYSPILAYEYSYDRDVDFQTRHSQTDRQNRCLTFLVMDGAVVEPGQGDGSVRRGVDERPGLGRPALTYSLDTGVVRWRDPSTGEYPPPIALRSNTRLAQWEPMTRDKFELIALELGVLDGDDSSPTPTEDLGIAALVVSPEGHIFGWDRSGLAVSDVRRLSALGQRPLIDPIHHRGQWADGATRALVGSGMIPQLADDLGFGLDGPDLPDYAHEAMIMLAESGNRDTGLYTPDAAQFIADQFGVDAHTVDWAAANKARLINASFAEIAPFDPISATQALRLAAGNSTRPELSPARVQRTTMTHTDSASRPRPGTAAPGK